VTGGNEVIAKVRPHLCKKQKSKHAFRIVDKPKDMFYRTGKMISLFFFWCWGLVELRASGLLGSHSTT
jgi:hypothetical protein